MSNYNDQAGTNDEFYLQKALIILRKNWYWFALSLIISFSYSKFKLMVATPIYTTSSLLMVKTNGGLSNPTDLIFGNGLLSKQRTEIINETSIIRSYPLVNKAILALRLDISYFEKGNFRNIELYKHTPFVVEMDTSLSTTPYPPYGVSFELEILDENQFKISAVLEADMPATVGKHKFGETFRFGSRSYSVDRNSNGVGVSGNEVGNYLFNFSNPVILTYGFKSGLVISPIDEQSSILSISMDGNVPQKSVDFLQMLITIYSQQNLDEKNQVATNTIDFITTELQTISDSLKKVEQELAFFKSDNQVMAVENDVERIMVLYESLETENAEQDLRVQYLEYLENALKKGEGLDKLISASAFGIEDRGLEALTTELAERLIQKNSIRDPENPNNDFSRLVDQRIENLTLLIQDNLKQLKSAGEMANSNLEKRMKSIELDIKKLPLSERNLIRIQREYNLSEKIFLLLMEKKAEAEITKSSNTPDVKVVEEPRLTSLGPISPKKRNMYLFAIIVGLILPTVFFVLREVLNDTLKTKDDLKFPFAFSFLGYISKARHIADNIIQEYPRSQFTESFRTLRTNMNFVLGKKSNNVFLITSLVPKEGKTFITKNLAISMTYGGKRTIMLGADLRKPRLHKEFNMQNGIGLSDFLVGNATLDDVIQSTFVKDLDIIPAGTIPPNPLELLEGEAFKNLIEELKGKYENVMIDTSPLGLVSDSKAIFNYSDMVVLVTRYRFTRMQMVRNMQESLSEFQKKSFSVLINGFDGYEHYYGYYGKSTYYGEESKGGFWKIFRKKDKRKF